jgi:hypothetical protein
MTVAGWGALLIDSLENHEDKYINYTCHYEIFINTAWKKYWLKKLRSWPVTGTWIPWINGSHFWKDRHLRACSECLKDSYYIRLHWKIGWMTTCPIHSIALDEWMVIDKFNSYIRGPDPDLLVHTIPAMYRLDSFTMQAVTEGKVSLPDGRILRAGVWLRLLRGLLDELTAPPTITKRHSDLIDGFWEEAALDTRNKYKLWQPVEQMPVDRGHGLLKVAAVAVDHVLTNRCVAMGADGSLLNVPPKDTGDLPSAWSPRLPRWTLPPDPFVDPKKMTYEQRQERRRREVQHMFACIAEEQAAAGRP